MKRSTVFSIAIFLLILSIGFTSTYAADPSIVASVDIQNPSIVSQNGNTFVIDFTMTNGAGLQTGVKYGVLLVPTKADYAADAKIYDETLMLPEKASIKKEITYTAPAVLTGDYSLYLEAGNGNNFQFATVPVGTATLAASTRGIMISPDTCFVQVNGETAGTHYKLSQNVDIKGNETLHLTCTAMNQSATAVTAMPVFQTSYYNEFGAAAAQTGGDSAPISFAAGEQKIISLDLPKGPTPQFYYTAFSLGGTGVTSNTAYINYIIDGVNGILQKISLDKDRYATGDQGTLSLVWSATAGNYARSGVKPGTPPTVMLKATITDKNGNACAAAIDQVLVKEPNQAQTTIPFAVTTSCVDPSVAATLTDASGIQLDQKNAVFTSNTSSHGPVSRTAATIILGALVLITAVGIILKKRGHLPTK